MNKSSNRQKAHLACVNYCAAVLAHEMAKSTKDVEKIERAQKLMKRTRIRLEGFKKELRGFIRKPDIVSQILDEAFDAKWRDSAGHFPKEWEK